MTDYEAGATVYAGNLGSAHIGDDVKLDFIHKYRYAGEEREKIKTIIRPQQIIHRKSGVFISGFATVEGYNKWTELNATTEILVSYKKEEK